MTIQEVVLSSIQNLCFSPGHVVMTTGVDEQVRQGRLNPISFCQIGNDSLEFSHRVAKYLRYGFHAVDPSHDLSGNGNGRFHVTAKIKIMRMFELAHDICGAIKFILCGLGGP